MELATIISIGGPLLGASYWIKGKITEHDVKFANIEADLKEVKDLLFAEFRGDQEVDEAGVE